MDNLALELTRYLEEQKVASGVSELVGKYLSLLPPGVDFESDVWNVIRWNKLKRSERKCNVNLFNIKHYEVRFFAKIFILDRRLKKNIYGLTAKTFVDPFKYLSQALGARDIKSLTTADVYEAEKLINANHKKSAPGRMCAGLERVATWMGRVLSIPIDYKQKNNKSDTHGRYATDEEKEEKLIDTSVLRDLLASFKSEGLILKDKFFLSALTILIATGLRVNELLTLPKDCLIEEEGNLLLRFFPEKKPKLGVRPIPSDFADSVKDAYQFIKNTTNEGRAIAKRIYDMPLSERPVNYHYIASDNNEEAMKYFAAKFAHSWTSQQVNKIFENNGAWIENRKTYIDIEAMLKKYGNACQVQKFTGITRGVVPKLLEDQHRTQQGLLPLDRRNGKVRKVWDTDSRIISINCFCFETNIFHWHRKEMFSDVIEQARHLQLQGQVYPMPEYNEEHENNYRQHNALLSDGDGNSVLMPYDALFVIQQNKLTTFNIKKDRFTAIGDRHMSSWLCGELRSKGKGNQEDSVFERLNIIDERTGKTAKFVSHDVRHWLTTFFIEGGMSEELVALIFNRDIKQNATYDQISSKKRLNNLREAIVNGTAVGGLADTYQSIASYDKDAALEFLKAETIAASIMPQGACTLTWGMQACDNHMSCLDCVDKETGEMGVCPNFSFESSDESQVEEVNEIIKTSEATLSVIPSASPQREHYERILVNAKKLISKDE